MKVRIYCPLFPYPVSEGAFHVMFDQARTLAKHNEVEIVTWKDSAEDLKRKYESFKGSSNFDIKVVHFSDSRALPQTVDRAKRVLKSLVTPAASPELFYYPDSSDQRATLGPCDLAIYHYSFAYNWLRKSRPITEKKVVVMFHNLESDLFEVRAKREDSAIARTIHQLNSQKLQGHERQVAQLADEVWHLSESDLTKLSSRNPDLKVPMRVVPPSFDEALFETRFKNFEKIKPTGGTILGFVGHLDFDPNRQSVEWILENVAPILNEQGFSGEFIIGGRNPPEALVKKAKTFPFVRFLGFVEDLESYFARLDLSLIPHIDGSGVRIKLLESIASGIPVIANSAAVERVSLGLRNSPLLRVSDDPREWAEMILNTKNHLDRAKFKNLGMHPSLQGEAIYSFLKST